MSDTKRKQDERVYFKIQAGGPEGWASVAGDYDLIVILKPEVQIGNYSHIYVTNTQIVDPPKSDVVVVDEEADDGL